MKISLDNCRLKRIRYESSGGSMNFHSEFEIEADADEIIRTAYWSDYCFGIEESSEKERFGDLDSSYRTNAGADAMPVREHIPMDQKLWTALAEEVAYLKEQLEPVEKAAPPVMPALDMFVLDGGDYTRLWLTWDVDGEEKTGQYYCPAGNRWYSVLLIIHEMVRPIGRDLRRIGETQITDFFLKAPEFSYQISPIKGSEEYYFFVHGDESDKSRISHDQWRTVREFLKGLDISGFGVGKYESRYYLRLNYNDGINKNLEIDKKSAEQIRKFIRENIIEM